MRGRSKRRMMDRKIVELLMGGASVKHIACSLHVSKTRVRRLREQAKEHGYLNEQGGKGGAALPPYPEAIFPDPVDRRTLRLSEHHQLLEPHRHWIQERLEAGWHAVTVFEELMAWSEQCKLAVSAVTRSSFYRYLERYRLNRLGESYRVVPEIVHRPGEALILDWGKLRGVVDPVTARSRTLWMFVGVLGFSRYLMARLVCTMDAGTTLAALESMFREVGGVPGKITIDNPKCIALEASRYEPLLNPVAERFAAHYGVLIEALPPGDPKKKGKIERAVPYVRRLYEAHADTWHGIEESQQYLNRKLAIANERRHGTTLRRPREVFVQEEAAALKPLPALAYQIEQFHEGIVRKDGHVRFQSKYYSVDESHIGQSVVVLGSSKLVSIYRGGKLLEVHARITDPYQSKSTKPQHLKPWERAMEDGSLYRKRAAVLGPHVEQMVLRLLQLGRGFVDTRKIWGILSLDKRYAAQRIDRACRRALQLERLSYRTVKSLLEAEEVGSVVGHETAGSDGSRHAPSQQKKAGHKHVRPLSVYREQLLLFAR
jgi:transposase